MKIHFDAESHFGRPRTACGATAARTREHSKVTCMQCMCTSVFKNGPRVAILGTVISHDELAALRKLAEGVRDLRDGVPGVYATDLFNLYNALPSSLKGTDNE